MSLIFSFAEKLYAAWPKDKTGNINQFLLPFCGVRKFLFFRLGQYSAPGSKTPKGLGLLVKITVKGGKLCTNELKQCVSHGAPAFYLQGFMAIPVTACVQNICAMEKVYIRTI